MALVMWPAGVLAADEVAGTRSNLVVEREHAITLQMDYDHAKLVVQRTVYNGGERHDQAMFWIDLPKSAVAAGLRTRGSLNGRPKWFDGELLEAETAAARYRELTGIGGYYPKDPALLSWRAQGLLALQVFPVDPGGPKTIEYTLHLPTEYEGGRHRLLLPPMGTDEQPAQIVLRPAHRLDQLFLDDAPIGTGKRVILDREVEIGLARRDAPLLSGRLASYPFGDARVLVEYEMHAAAKISEVPSDARIVVLIDTSRSRTASETQASVTAARAYLAHFAEAKLRARAQVVTFDRRPVRRHDAMLPVDQVLADLETFAPIRRNGSHVDAALEQALDILDDSPRGGPRRIVLFTDALTRSSLAPARLQALATRSRAIVHIVDIGGRGELSLLRDDDHDWAGLARSTGGLVWTAAVGDAGEDEAMLAVFEELARPLRVDRLRVVAAGLPPTAETFPAVLDEGEGVGDLLISERGVRHIKLEGELWSRPIREIVTPSEGHAKLWAGLVFGSELLHDLSESEMMRLAVHGRVVSPVTSYLAIEPGVRPSTEGLDWAEGGAGVGFAMGTGRSGVVRYGASPNTFDPQGWLAAQLRAAVRRCGVPKAEASVELETTRAEIADVVSVTMEPSDAVARDCLREEVWSFELPSEFQQRIASWTIHAR
jgi:hypothetical protein